MSKESDTILNRFNQLLSKYPARLNYEVAGAILGFVEADIRILVTNGFLKPLGNPRPNATKYFALIDLTVIVGDSSKLRKASNIVYEHWNKKNARKNGPVESSVDSMHLVE